MKLMFGILFLLILISCNGSSKNDVIEKSGLEIKFILKDEFNQESKSFVQAENIELFITLTNNSTEVITLNFGSSKMYDFYILTLTNDEIWRWSADKVFATVVSNREIMPGETIEGSETWNQVLADGEIISVGSYSVFGSFLDQSPEVQFDFEIQ
jgi:hypothetical protein